MSHYTRGSVTTLRDFGGGVGTALDTFLWDVTNSWSRLLACVWSGPYHHLEKPGHIWCHTTIEGPWPHYVILEVCLGRPLDTFLVGCHKFMVTALGSCVKWHLPSPWRAQSHMMSHYNWGSMTTLHDFGGVFGTAFGHFFLGLSQIHGNGSWLVCKVALTITLSRWYGLSPAAIPFQSGVCLWAEILERF
jgi:hypothetical protein